jgi:hypothetical protein
VKPHFRSSSGLEYSTEGSVSLGDGPLNRSSSRNFPPERNNLIVAGNQEQTYVPKETPILQTEQNGDYGELFSEVEEDEKMTGSQDLILKPLKQRLQHQSLTY